MGLANRISSPGTALTELVALAQPLATPRRPASGRIGLSSYGAQHLASPLPVSPGRLGRTPAARSSSDRRRYRRWGCALRVARRRPSRISQALLHELMHPRHVHPDLLGRQLAQHLRVHVDLEVLPRAGVIDVGLPVLRDQHERRQKDRLERDDELSRPNGNGSSVKLGIRLTTIHSANQIACTTTKENEPLSASWRPRPCSPCAEPGVPPRVGYPHGEFDLPGRDVRRCRHYPVETASRPTLTSASAGTQSAQAEPQPFRDRSVASAASWSDPLTGGPAT